MVRRILNEVFLVVVYGIASVKNASVMDNLEMLSNVIQWNVSFIQAVQNWEVDAISEFFDLP